MSWNQFLIKLESSLFLLYQFVVQLVSYAVISYSYSSLYMLYILQNVQRTTTLMQYIEIIFSNSLSDFSVFILSLHC
jgi:hypothetical protein